MSRGQGCPGGQPPFEGGRFLPTCETALYHCVVYVVELGSCDFLCFLCAAGFDFCCEALAVESDYFYRIIFEGAVGVERAAEDVANVCHDFEVFEVFNCAPGRV